MKKLTRVVYEVESHSYDFRGEPTNKKRKTYYSLKDAVKAAGSEFKVFIVQTYEEETELPLSGFTGILDNS